MAVTKCKIKDRTTCLAARKSSCKAAVPQGVKLVPQRADLCVKAVSGAYEDAKLGADELHAVDKACNVGLFAGPFGPRAACTTNVDCDATQNLECVKAYGASEGKCLVPVLVAPASSCAGEADRCTDDSFCDGTTKVCVAKRAEGQQCQPGYAYCTDDLVCQGGGRFRGPLQRQGRRRRAVQPRQRVRDEHLREARQVHGRQLHQVMELSPLSNACAGFGS